jgi:hypothetical protein
MRTLASLFSFLLLAACLSSCGTEATDTIKTLLPAENAVPGFVYNPDYQMQPVIKSKAELMDGYPDATQKVGGINGSATPFVEHNFSSFLQGFYSDGNFKVKTWLFQMPDVATSEKLFNDIVVTDKAHAASTWEAANVGDAGRVAFGGTTAILNARKSLFYFEVILEPESGSDVPESTKQIVIDFGKVIASNVK